MKQTSKTAATKRGLTTIALAILWLAGAAGGWAAEPPTGPTYTNSLGMALVRFNAGAFVMGEGTSWSIPETSGSPLDWDEQPAHPVVLTTPFYVMTVRVPKAQFDQAGLDAAPDDGRVSWDRAAAFCAWLSQKEGLTYRLPTEAEWEYVRRNPGDVTDFEGEWVSDWHGAYLNGVGLLKDPAGPLTGMMKVIRADATNRLCQPPSLEGKATFRILLDTAPTNHLAYSPLPFNQMAVKQSTAPALQGPDPSKPYFTVRFAALDSPGVNLKAMGVDPAFDPGHLHHSALEIMPNGDVLASWFCSGILAEYGPNVRIVQVRLRYGAEEFDMPELFIKAKWNDEQDISPCLWRDGTTNWLFTGWNYPRLFRVSRSTDSGATWTTIVPEFLSTNGFYQPINSAFRAPDGTLYVPVDMPFPSPQSALFRSSDNGLTWTNQPGLTTSGRHSTIVPLDQTGRLLSLGGKSASINGYMPQNISTNWGATWEASTQTPFPSLGSGQRPSVSRLASGNLVVVGDAGNASISNGPAPYVALSDDNGATWHIKPLPVALKKTGDPNKGYTIGYTTVRGAPNGLIHVVTSLTIPAVHYEFNEAWVYSEEGDIAPETGGGSVTNYSENYPGGARKATWSARICPNGRYLLDGVETNYYENGTVQRVVTWASGRRTGEETLWAPNGVKFWSWSHDLTNNVSTWTKWWSNGRKRFESQRDTNPMAPALPDRHFRGLMSSGNSWFWDPDGRSVNASDFPACVIISPTNGTVVYAGTNVSIVAAAASVNSDITNMVCSVDRVPVGSSTNGLFTFDWPATAASVGSHVISVTALDRGKRTANASVGIRVLSRVACAITTPADLTVVHVVGMNVTLAATASSLDAGISKVEFFVNGAKIGEDATAPYSCLWTNAPMGNYVLTARATDNNAQTGVSDAVLLIATASWDGARATGGTVANYTVNGVNCTAHIFTNSGTLTVTAGGTVEVLVVGGGGGGGGGDSDTGAGGGGGAGGLLYTNLAVTAGSYAVSVGAGGAGGVANGNNASAGSNSAFGALIALGGGRGDRIVATSAGGSGAGGFGRGMAGGSATQPGSVSGGYGHHAGGASTSNPGGGGGGGGAGSAGSSGGPADGGNGGNGGSGFTTFLSGSPMSYAGGGGGGCQSGLMYGTATAGGGDGGAYRANGTHATPNTGGGGGGGGVHGGSGGNGGSGIVIVWYGGRSRVGRGSADLF